MQSYNTLIIKYCEEVSNSRRYCNDPKAVVSILSDAVSSSGPYGAINDLEWFALKTAFELPTSEDMSALYRKGWSRTSKRFQEKVKFAVSGRKPLEEYL